MNFKRITGLVLTVALTASLFAGCAKKEPVVTEDPNKEVTLVWQRGKDTTPAAAKLIEAFQAKNPKIKVKIGELPATSSEQYNTYTTALSSGDNSFDIVTMDIVWANAFASAGWLEPLDSRFKNQSDFFKGPIDAMKFDSKIYAVPLWTDAGVLYYRKDLVPTPPKTWDELIKISKDNIGKNGIKQGMLFQAFQNEGLVCNAMEFILGNGGSVLDKDGKAVIDGANSVEAVKIMKKLIDEKVSPAGVVTYKPQDCIDQYKLGETLFMRNWPFAFSALNAADSKVKDKFAITTMPMGPNGTEPAATLGGWNVGINKNSKNKDAAWKFIEFISSDEGQKINAIEGAYMPTKEKLYTDKDVLAKFPHFQQLLPVFKIAKSRPLTPFYSKVSELMQVNIHKGLTAQVDIETALKDAAKGINEVNKK